jgi:DNA-binding HxlR family transcriptional regulator
MRITHEEAAGQPQGGLLGRALRRGRASEARKRVADDGCHHDGVPCLPVPRRTGSPLDWRGILARLAPVRHRWDLAILANLAGDVDSPADLLEVINGQAETGRQLSPQVLSGRLRRLEEAGYVGHAEISRIPRRRRYWLLPRGRRLLDALNVLDAWYEAQRPCDSATGTAGTGQLS